MKNYTRRPPQRHGPDLCPAAAHGYFCNRAVGMHDIHHDPDGTWWIFEPKDDTERGGFGPFTSYRIITDPVLPFIRDTYDMQPLDQHQKLNGRV